MSDDTRRTLLAFLALGIMLVYFAFGVSFIEVESMDEYPLVEIAGGKTPVYISRRELGYFYTYMKDGREIPEYMPSEKVKETANILHGDTPRVRYTYTVGTYRFSIPGGSFDAKAPPHFDSVEFLIPEGAIAEF